MENHPAEAKIPIVHEGERPAYSEDGVDLTLIRWMLSLTPLERLETLQNYAASAWSLRNARRQV